MDYPIFGLFKKKISARDVVFLISCGRAPAKKQWWEFEWPLLTKNAKGIFVSYGRYWRGVYIHFNLLGSRKNWTVRFFVHKTKKGWRPGMDTNLKHWVFTKPGEIGVSHRGCGNIGP